MGRLALQTSARGKISPLILVSFKVFLARTTVRGMSSGYGGALSEFVARPFRRVKKLTPIMLVFDAARACVDTVSF
jgi:hypothetical protein